MTARRVMLICPGRGSYTQDDLGYLHRRLALAPEVVGPIVDTLDAARARRGRPTISELDGAERFSARLHLSGGNAGPLIYACTVADLALVARTPLRPVVVGGNSMGWYTALNAAGCLDVEEGLRLVERTSRTPDDRTIGGQSIYPIFDADWRPDPELERIVAEALERARSNGASAAVSIRLGGYVVIAGDEQGLAAVEKSLPTREVGRRRYPFRLAGHSAFHTPLMSEHAATVRADLEDLRLQAPAVPLIDGRGGAWRPWSTSRADLVDYTLGTQMVSTFDFTATVRVGLREYAPETIVLLGPGQTLGGAIGQAVCREGWTGIRKKDDFAERQSSDDPILVSLGRTEDFERHIAPLLDAWTG